MSYTAQQVGPIPMGKIKNKKTVHNLISYATLYRNH